jgi:hypothetical protein
MSTLSAVRTHRLCKRVGFLFLIGILIISCSIQKAAGTRSAVDEGDGGDSGDGGSDSSDSEEAGDENIEGYDFTSYFPCPDTPRAFALFVDFSLYVEDEEGRHYTQHTQNEGDLNLNYVVLNISKSGVEQVYDAIVPIVIEGESDDCFITGDGAIRLEVGGTCRGEKAYLEVLGTYESWSQTIKCPGQAPITRSDADFPAPSLDGEFLLSTAGDLVTEGMNLEQIRYAFRWTLKAYSGDEGPDERPEPPEPLPPISE